MPAAKGTIASSGNKDVNHYEVLGLPAPSIATKATPPSQQDIKAAYRRALLVHHPDKAPASPQRGGGRQKSTKPPDPTSAPPRFTVDAIREAYQTLSTPSLRRECDRRLQSQARTSGTAGMRPSQTTELDVLDLGDMNFNTKTTEYTSACRCGNRKGFCISEEELTEVDGTEVLLECPDCSHHVRVCFEIEEEDQDEAQTGVARGSSSGARTWTGEGVSAGMKWQASLKADCIVS